MCTGVDPAVISNLSLKRIVMDAVDTLDWAQKIREIETVLTDGQEL